MIFNVDLKMIFNVKIVSRALINSRIFLVLLKLKKYEMKRIRIKKKLEP